MSSMLRYPESTTTTAEIGIEAVNALLVGTDEIDPHVLWHDLSVAAAHAAETGDLPRCKALWLVADASSVTMNPRSIHEAFEAKVTSAHGRSAVVDDFEPADLQFLADVSVGVHQPWLKARLADIVWLCARPRNLDDVLRAIDAYMATPLTQDNWLTILPCWERAITLCLQIRKGAGDRLSSIEQALAASAENALAADGGLGLSSVRLLFEKRLVPDKALHFANLVAKRAADFAASKEFYRARFHMDLAGVWYERLQEPGRAADMILETAQSYQAEADERITAGPVGHSIAVSFFEDAIQVLRRIPTEYRASRGADQLMERLERRLAESGLISLKAMVPLKTDPVDISDLIGYAEKRVAGKSFGEALLLFANIHPGAQYAKLKEAAEQALRREPLAGMFAGTHMGLDGRVIAKTPGADPDSEPLEFEKAVQARVMRYYVSETAFVGQALLLPALLTINAEHRVGFSELAEVMSHSPVVPPGRAEQFARGLWAGFEQDMSTAIHVLAPQVENMVRWHLNKRNVRTTTLSKSGIRTEDGLSTLMSIPEARGLFREDVAFEIEALFCSALGPNFRNGAAHGLLAPEDCNTFQGLYAWWLVLRLTFNTFWNSLSSEAQAHVTETPASPADEAPDIRPANSP